MGIQINGQTDTITATDGSFTIQGADVGSVSANPVTIGTGASISSPATNVLTLGTNNSERVRVSAAGSFGIGTNNPTQLLDVYNGNINLYALTSGQSIRVRTSNGTIGELAQISGDGTLRLYTNETTPILRTQISSYGDTYINPNGGNVGINSTIPTHKLDIIGGSSSQLQVTGTESDIWMKSTGPGNKVWRLLGSTGGGTHRFRIYDHTASLDRLNITDTGDLLLCTTSTGAQIEIDTDNTYAGGDAGCGIRLMHTSTSLGSNNALLGLNCATTNASTYRMAQFNSGTTRSAFGDAEFVFYGNGNGNADGSWTGGGADYAEYFEWSDGNVNDEDRRGISVVLDGNKIREALVGEDPIGVISGNPSMVGDAAWNKWSGKYLRDDYGSYVRDENGERQLNPAFNPDEEYVPREQRPEWDCVGLMGKLRIRKGQVTGSRWIKMRDVSDNVEEWLVR